jgi:Transposase DDE domain group 1
MNTHCTHTDFHFEPLSDRPIVARFDGGTITADGGALLLAEVEPRTAIRQRLAQCFTDHRDPDLIEHTTLQLLRQRL